MAGDRHRQGPHRGRQGTGRGPGPARPRSPHRHPARPPHLSSRLRSRLRSRLSSVLRRPGRERGAAGRRPGTPAASRQRAASGAGVLADSVAPAGDADKVITIADPSFAEHGVRFTGMDPADRFPEALPVPAALIAAGTLDVPVWRTYPLAEAARAHADIEADRDQGKVVLLP
ncbi:zinc-binding dehydrogenase [Streptomyces sp. NA02950]|uniref:zinc-binding dehydrogenase n=1 Tax=Streptomyces sp. NA02950 TaxID=2742137 RepID=UPI0026DF0A17|nr:zinc-binding dehydrogenase [Streptomyces sp. NA02950]